MAVAGPAGGDDARFDARVDLHVRERLLAEATLDRLRQPPRQPREARLTSDCGGQAGKDA